VSIKREGLTCAALVSTPLLWGVAAAHIRIFPAESVQGAREKYTMRPNPKQGDKLVWKFTQQYYADGNKEEFIGPAGTLYPAPVVTLQPESISR
jgi:uncharacterized protein YcnI